MMSARARRQLPLLILVGLVLAAPLATASEREDIRRDVFLSVPAAAKATLGAGIITLGLIAGIPDLATPTDVASYAAGATISLALAASNTALLLSAWSDRPAATRMWRRIDVGVVTAWLVAGLAFLIPDAMAADPAVGLLTTVLPFTIGAGLLIWVDTLPFSTETQG